MNLLRAIICLKHLYNSLNPVMFHFLHNCPCSLIPYYIYAQVSRCSVHVLSLGFHDPHSLSMMLTSYLLRLQHYFFNSMTKNAQPSGLRFSCHWEAFPDPPALSKLSLLSALMAPQISLLWHILSSIVMTCSHLFPSLDQIPQLMFHFPH